MENKQSKTSLNIEQIKLDSKVQRVNQFFSEKIPWVHEVALRDIIIIYAEHSIVKTNVVHEMLIRVKNITWKYSSAEQKKTDKGFVQNNGESKFFPKGKQF